MSTITENYWQAMSLYEKWSILGRLIFDFRNREVKKHSIIQYIEEWREEMTEKKICKQCGENEVEDKMFDLCEGCQEMNLSDNTMQDKLFALGHTVHCCKRMVWGDGQCECRVDKKMDHKYGGHVWKSANREVVSPEEWIVFRAQDMAVPYMLDYYYQKCASMGSPMEHLKRILDLKMRVMEWQAQNPDKCKVPD